MLRKDASAGDKKMHYLFCLIKLSGYSRYYYLLFFEEMNKFIKQSVCMISFTATIKRFGEQGEKTGWTFIDVLEKIAQQMMPGNKRSFRVKGSLDKYIFEGMSLIPIGGGNFILPLKAEVRKCIGKTKGAVVDVKMEVDESPVILSAEMMQCLADEPAALAYFNKLPGSHQKYYSRWIESAKSDATKAKRIAETVTACARGQHYGEMMKSLKESNDLLK